MHKHHSQIKVAVAFLQAKLFFFFFFISSYNIFEIKSSAMDSEIETRIKRTKHDDDSNCFDQLPHETVIDILSRLPITSLIQLSFVCRSLNSLSHDPHLVNTHLSKSSTNASSCLIFHSDYPIQNQLHFLQLSDDQKVRRIDTPFCKSMPEFSIIGSSNGVLCLINTLFPESMYLYNPFTAYYSEIPKNFDFENQIIVYGFGFHPITNDYKVIKIAYYNRSFYYHIARHFRGFKTNANIEASQVDIYSSSSNTWTKKELVPYKLEKWSSPGVFVNGRLHWVSRWGKFLGGHKRVIVSYDLGDDSFHVIDKPGPDTGSFRRWGSCQLAVLEGCLCAAIPVPSGHGAFNIWIMKEYGVNESWVKEYSIGVYNPVSMVSHEMERSYHIWRRFYAKKLVKILCFVKNGEVLLEYRGGGLVSYDLHSESFKELVYIGMPRLYETTLHVGSLVSPPLPSVKT